MLDREITWQVGVSQGVRPDGQLIVATLREAIQAWNDQAAGTVGAIVLLDNATYDESLTREHQIVVPRGSRLIIVAADWPDDGSGRLVPGRLSPVLRRPHINGGLAIVGDPSGEGEAGEVILNGLVIEGAVNVLWSGLGSLRLTYCTLVPGAGWHAARDSGAFDLRGSLRRRPADRAARREEHHR
jgi:hypothetical protein